MNRLISGKIIMLTLAGLVFTAGLGAFSFEPITRSFAPSGRAATQSFRLKNDSNEHLAIQLRMFTREIDENGEESNEPADELFTVYPSNIVLKPQSTQTVKVRWEGPQDLTREECFRILVEQLPVTFEDDTDSGGNIRILFKYLGSIYITPEDTAPDILISSIETQRDEEGSLYALLLFENRGSRHTILIDLKVTLTDQGGELAEISSEQLEGIDGENLLPGGRRRVTVKLPEYFKEGEIDAEFTFTPTP